MISIPDVSPKNRPRGCMNRPVFEKEIKAGWAPEKLAE